MGPAAADVRQEAAYYQAIEEFFVARRGDPLLLSNADWTLIRRWRQAGLPLRVALRGIADALEGHAHSWARARKVGSLRYCATEVERAYERWQAALGGGAWAEGPDAARARLRDALLAALPALEGDLRSTAARIAEDLQAAAPAGGAALEAWLKKREDRLLEAVRVALGPGPCAELEREVEAELRPYRERLPARVLEQVRGDALRRRLLGGLGLPRLTLFEG